MCLLLVVTVCFSPVNLSFSVHLAKWFIIIEEISLNPLGKTFPGFPFAGGVVHKGSMNMPGLTMKVQ